jgi:pimeloyl-ACP methyl ester carboxylesterase
MIRRTIGLVLMAAAASTAAAAKPERQTPPKITGTYRGGELIELRVGPRAGYLVRPTGRVDPTKRWVWIFPYWLGVDDANGRLHHRSYVEELLAKGFHVAGVDVGTSCGSPAGAAVCHEFYTLLTHDHGLNPRARLIVQSNGGLIGYAWAFRHPDRVDRIGGIYPATDFRTWPGLANVLAYPEKGLGYDLTPAQLSERAAEFNPIDNLAPLAKAGVKVLHVHGDKDALVPMAANTTELVRRYRGLGGEAEAVVLPGLVHGGAPFYESRRLIEFLEAD